MPIVFLVGVNHAHQYPDSPHGSSETFASFVEAESRLRFVDLLAEEMSAEALEWQRLKTSTVQLVATRLGVRHIFCDPNQQEREALGIPSRENIKARLGIGRCMTSAQNTALETEESTWWPKREAEWLRRVSEASFETCLFIIGSKHIPSFSDLLNRHQYQTTVLHYRWEA